MPDIELLIARWEDQQGHDRPRLRLSEDLPMPISAGQPWLTCDVQYQGREAFVALHQARWPRLPEGDLVVRLVAKEPYVPGYFAFREGPVLAKAIRLWRQRTGLEPALVMVDGHGTAHPRGFGLACWLGLELDLPCLGLAKESLLRFGEMPGPEAGCHAPILLEGEPVGHVFRGKAGVKPVFASPGHRVSLAQCLELVAQLEFAHRLPEPARRADQAARAAQRGQDAGFAWMSPD